MSKRQEKKQYPKSCNMCGFYNIAKKLFTNNGCGKCPNREYVKKCDVNEEKHSLEV